MNEGKIKSIATVVCICFCAMAGSVAVGFRLGRHSSRGSDRDTERAERYETSSTAAQNAVSELESRLSDVAEQMHTAGREIESGITDVGELGEVSDRIAGASTDIARHACRIEEGIQRIERILYEAEENSFLLEDNSDCTGSDGGS